MRERRCSSNQRRGSLLCPSLSLWSPCWTAALLLLVTFPGASLAQAVPAPPLDQATALQSAAGQSQPAASAEATKPARKHISSDRRRAVKLYLESSRLFEKEQFEEAMRGYRQAAELDPSNPDYSLAADVARSHAATALVQAAAKDRMSGDAAAARIALERALVLDPKSPQATAHLDELGDDALLSKPEPIYEEGANSLGAGQVLAPVAGVQSFHLRTGQRQVIIQVFKAYGIEASVDESIPSGQARLDLDGANFGEATRALCFLTRSFYVPLDEHRVLVARDTRENRQKFSRLELETVYLPGLTSEELTAIGNLSKNIFGADREVTDPSTGSITIRAPAGALRAFNATLRNLLDGSNQVMLEVRLIQIAHTSQRNTGIQPPQSMSAFNVYAEEQSILNANQSLVQQIISSGLAAPGDTFAILGILLASGQVSSSLFSNGFALFGGGITQSALSPGGATVNFNLNSSDTRALDQIQLRLGDGETGTLRTGMRYPIMTSSYSSLAGSSINIPGLTTAGVSSALSSLLSSVGGAGLTVPQVEYQDLGLTLKATANVIRNGDVALTLDMKIDALAGGSLNGIPVQNNRSISTVVTLKQDAAVVLVSNLNKQESRAVSGTPGMGEIPGLNNVSDKNTENSYATLLVIITPHVIRGTQLAGHIPMIRIEAGQEPH